MTAADRQPGAGLARACEVQLIWSGRGERVGRPSPARAGDAQPDRERDRAWARAGRGPGPRRRGRRAGRGDRQRSRSAGARRRADPPARAAAAARAGRGLAIAAAVAEAHGGRLAAAPSERGARLVLELPAARRCCAGSVRAAGQRRPRAGAAAARRPAQRPTPTHTCRTESDGIGPCLLQCRAQHRSAARGLALPASPDQTCARPPNRPSRRAFPTVGKDRAPKWGMRWEMGCIVGESGIKWAPHAEPGWQGSSHPATRVRSSVSRMRTLDLPRNLRTRARREAPADGPCEVPGGAGGWGGAGGLARGDGTGRRARSRSGRPTATRRSRRRR